MKRIVIAAAMSLCVVSLAAVSSADTLIMRDGTRIEGTMTGTLAEAREMMELARSGKIPPVPIIERPLSAAQASLDDLRAGKIVGRVVLGP